MRVISHHYCLISMPHLSSGNYHLPSVLCSVTQSCLILCGLMDCSLPGSSVHGDSPGKNIGLGFHDLLQGIFPTLGSNSGLLHCRWILYHLSHQGSPYHLSTPNQRPPVIKLQLNSHLLQEALLINYSPHKTLPFLIFGDISFLKFLFCIRVQLINHVCYFQVYSEEIQLSICMYLFFKFFPQLHYYRVLSRVLCVIQ